MSWVDSLAFHEQGLIFVGVALALWLIEFQIERTAPTLEEKSMALCNGGDGRECIEEPTVVLELQDTFAENVYCWTCGLEKVIRARIDRRPFSFRSLSDEEKSR